MIEKMHWAEWKKMGQIYFSMASTSEQLRVHFHVSHLNIPFRCDNTIESFLEWYLKSVTVSESNNVTEDF